MNKLDEQILCMLKETGPLTLVEIAERLDKKPKTVFGSLRRLFENGEIDCDPKTRKYSVAAKE
ncbi:MAG: Lrp/AsnC family transcriptional regulator [Candidatus Bathyarchaeia archaeon]